MSNPEEEDSLATKAEVDSPPESPQSDPRWLFPERIGRYRVIKLLGEGGFGRVYLAHDDELDRPVAIKVPRSDRISRPEDVETYLAEARTLARLDHPCIVPVLDVGRTDDGLCFVVSKYIEGTDLAGKLKQGAFSSHAAASLIATVADALHYAHSRHLVHRDVKPANILIDGSGRAFLADFGLALKEEDFGKGSGMAGTPAYMSPEQARGEGHRVDGRSDVFSLGVIFYELLTGRRPFQGKSQAELMEQIASADFRPPRQIDVTIPKELERICLMALSKRTCDRYTTSWDMADDINTFLRSTLDQLPAPTLADHIPPIMLTRETNSPQISPTPTHSDLEQLNIVPKGLRSFDDHDSDFFLELLPGPKDRNGLPESIRFWKKRIEEIDRDKTFRVGLLYGPSGCGKSSFMKAGLLPRISSLVDTIYVESTAADTEARLLRGLRRRFSDLPDHVGLAECLALLRRGAVGSSTQKVLLVLDQFEQWLHEQPEDTNSGLISALRHCDGERVQAIVMVRDDYWMAATRFMKEVEERIVEGENSSAVDLFDIRHATKVLKSFGRAYGAFPLAPYEMSKEQQSFLNQAIHGLSEGGKIISVKLALFSEMMKSKTWDATTLTQMGGIKAVGVLFLEEHFSPRAASPQHRRYTKAAMAVLEAMLPEQGMGIKGSMRSYEELLWVSGYGLRSENFDSLLRILDGELRLITPTENEALKEENNLISTAKKNRYYQLTHDYSVQAIRDWLHKHQTGTLWARVASWCKRQERVDDARLSGMTLSLMGIFLNFLGVAYWLLTSQWAERPREWLVQWSLCNILLVITAISCSQFSKKSFLPMMFCSIAFISFSIYYFAALCKLIPEQWVMRFGGLYDDAKFRFMPFLMFSVVFAFSGTLTAIALHGKKSRMKKA